MELGGEVDLERNTITVQVEHLTVFAAMVPQTDTPVLDLPPSRVRGRRITVTGAHTADSPVTLVIGGTAHASGKTDSAGRFALSGTLEPGRNWVYVMGEGPLASREWTVHYLPPYSDMAGHWAEAQVDALHELGVVSLYPRRCSGPTSG